MRLRNKPWAKPLIEQNTNLITTTPEKFKGIWNERFEKEQPIYIEIGMGKGKFIVEMAEKNPTINFIGLEIQTTAAAISLKKQIEKKLPNLQMICADGALVGDFFSDGEISGIYLNFSDPWPKKRQEKRRLTYKDFLSQYQKILAKDAKIELKTDNQKLFEYSLVSMNNFGMKFEDIWFDLHQDDKETLDNVMTEYEEKFSSKGQAIYKLVANFN